MRLDPVKKLEKADLGKNMKGVYLSQECMKTPKQNRSNLIGCWTEPMRKHAVAQGRSFATTLGCIEDPFTLNSPYGVNSRPLRFQGKTG